MKKRKISVLLFLVVVMCLTACGETPSEYDVGYVITIINVVLHILLGIASIVFIGVCIYWHVTD